MKTKDLLESKERSVRSVYGKQPSHAQIFYCDSNELTSLEGSPITVKDSFVAYRNNFTSFKGGPTTVGGIMYIYRNRLKSFEGAPEYIGKNFIVNDNEISSFEGAPRFIGGNLLLIRNKLDSLKGIHKYIKQINGVLNVSENNVSSHVLGVLRIEGLEALILDPVAKEVQDIINKHLAGDRDIFACQEELINAGFEEFAKL